ncbi:MAG: hypothetical protein AAFQ95_13565, partial [Cyanobacteria bacterium J06621_3]
MSKTPSDRTQNSENELLPAYRFDYKQAKSNRFAVNHKPEKLTVVADGATQRLERSKDGLYRP